MNLLFLRTVTLVVGLLALVGCASLDPVNVQYTKHCGWNTDKPGMEDGPRCASELRNRYLKAVSQRANIETASQVGLVGLVATVSSLAALDSIGTSEIAVAGIGGGLLLVAPRLTGSEQRDFIYLAGAEAMNCVLDATVEASLLLSDSEDKAARQRRRDILAGSMADLRTIELQGDSAESRQLNSILETADGLLRKARQSERQLTTVDRRILNVARSIDIRVTGALRRDRVDVREIVSGLSGAVGLVQEINTDLLNRTADAGSVSAFNSAKQEVRSKLAKVEAAIREVRLDIEEVEAALTPFNSESLRKRCSLNNVEVQPFSVSESRIVFAKPESGKTRSAVIQVRGGKAPHSASFSGKVPNEPSSLVRSVEETRDGAARIRVTVTEAVEPGTYRLLIREAGGRTAQTTIQIGTNSSQGKAAGTKTIGADQEKNEAVESMQSTLLAMSKCVLKEGSEFPGDQRAGFDPKKIDGLLGGEGSDTRKAANHALTFDDSGKPTTWKDLVGDIEARAAHVTKLVDDLRNEHCVSEGSSSGAKEGEKPDTATGDERKPEDATDSAEPAEPAEGKS